LTQQLTAPGFTAITPDSVEEVAARHGDPQWLRDRRAEAWRLYETMDLPDPADEEWRRTDVRALSFDGVRPYVSPDGAPPADVISADDVAGRIVQHDSAVVSTELADELRAKGVVLVDLHTAARDHADLLRQHLSSAVPHDEWKYLALNAALWSGGCFLYVPKGVVIDRPVQLSTLLSGGGRAAFPHTVIIAERESQVAFIDETHSPDSDEKTFVSGAVELYLGEGANVQYYSINRWGRGVHNFNTVRALLGRDARFTATVAGVGSTLTKMRADALMPEAGASAQLLGVTFGSDDQHFDYNTRQDHAGKNTVSDLQFKSALTDRASLVWYGVTRIQKTAGGSEANQTSRNLLLSEKAKAAPIPILEIEAYDVSKCSHGATAGPVDEEQLYYLQSRAIPRDVAEQLLVEGFFADVVDRIPLERLRERIMEAVMAKVGGRAGLVSYEEALGA
jgi:Fe-S cluster assembly protein SufD